MRSMALSDSFPRAGGSTDPTTGGSRDGHASATFAISCVLLRMASCIVAEAVASDIDWLVGIVTTSAESLGGQLASAGCFDRGSMGTALYGR